jgi:DNA-binding PucR family transcriptional regulator
MEAPMVSQQRLIDEYESLRRQSLDTAQRTTQCVTLALKAVMEGGIVGFMRCCTALLRISAAEPKAAEPIRQVFASKASLPSAELTHALAEMVLTIVSQELSQ